MIESYLYEKELKPMILTDEETPEQIHAQIAAHEKILIDNGITPNENGLIDFADFVLFDPVLPKGRKLELLGQCAGDQSARIKILSTL